ncbi:TetR/AcrR family transcriptional regulator [Nonomuraea sp. MG754425]|uniref:TetR/AcrR family transcriptional regulator n=1 Tax=Nonomuraea sp. MG754425 TaxID=2570319 RepID=UPI001F22017D|nr:TetR/AcrR family transcriptional regulator [Nonomuraea sp. MG754425]MCF6473168.1 TetR/AcrR family transcriptional regulator [Nonomuraea sp. MG754425]
MSETTTRRDRKKQQTRQAVGAAAMRLFLDRGFDSVTIADVAREADVAVQTVFNHFPSKEHLFFQERDSYVSSPSTAIRESGADEPIARALARGYLRLLGDYHVAGLLVHSVDYQRTLDASPALRTRELELRQEREDLLAATLAETAPPLGEGLRPRLMAAFASAVDRVLDAELRRRLLAGEPAGQVQDSVRPMVAELFDAAENACRDVRERM